MEGRDVGSVTNPRYHLVLATKYLRPGASRNRAIDLRCVPRSEKVSDFKIIEMNVEDGNHIHLALKMSLRYSVSSMVNRIKGITTHLVWGREPKRISRFHWKGKRALCHIGL